MLDDSLAKDLTKHQEKLLLALLLILPIAIFALIYSNSGPSWDMIARSLNGKTLFNYVSTNQNDLKVAFFGELTNNLVYYFEPYREPVGNLIFAILYSVFKYPILPYSVLAFAFYVFSICVFANQFKIDKLIAFSVFLNAYLIYYLFVPNGGEVLAISFILMGIAYLARGSEFSGLFFGIAALSKYPAMAMFPLVLLLKDRRKILIAIAIEALVLSSWGMVDYLVYGIPFYSYFSSISNANIITNPSTVHVLALLQVLAFPLIFGAIAYVLIRSSKSKPRILPFELKMSYLMIALAFLSYLVMLPHNDEISQARYGFIFSVSLLVPVSMALSNASVALPNSRYAIAALSLFMMLAFAVFMYSFVTSPQISYYNPGSENSIYANAASRMGQYGFADCRFISNAWVYMIYAGYDAYSPFIINKNASSSSLIENASNLNSTFFVSHQNEYPMLIFNYTGVDRNRISVLSSYDVVYANRNFSIYVPREAKCFPVT